MKIILQDYKILKLDKGIDLFIEECGRVCYKSEGKITEGSAKKFIKQIVDSGHHSVLEHGIMSVGFIVDRAISHEIVRHRLASYSQESQRFINYKKGIEFILPIWIPSFFKGTFNNIEDIHNVSSLKHFDQNKVSIITGWMEAMLYAEQKYKTLIELGLKSQQARTVLPNSTKTEIIMTCNLREWMHVFSSRCSKKAYPQIRILMLNLLVEAKDLVPIVFDGLYEKYIVNNREEFKNA